MEEVLEQVDRERIVELACNLANTVSITGDEENVAKYLGSELEKLGMQVEYQYVEDGRPNVVGTLKGTGGGATLMFNAHMDHFDNPQETVVDEDRDEIPHRTRDAFALHDRVQDAALLLSRNRRTFPYAPQVQTGLRGGGDSMQFL